MNDKGASKVHTLVIADTNRLVIRRVTPRGTKTKEYASEEAVLQKVTDMLNEAGYRLLSVSLGVYTLEYSSDMLPPGRYTTMTKDLMPL